MPTRRPRTIRPIAIGVIRNGDRILVSRGYDAERDQHFYRPLGGAIEFGERAEEALRREFQEELCAELVNPRLVGVSENRFTYRGELEHEIVFVFEADFADQGLYLRPELSFSEAGWGDRVATWIRLDEFSADAPLYPDGLLELLTGRD